MESTDLIVPQKDEMYGSEVDKYLAAIIKCENITDFCY